MIELTNILSFFAIAAAVSAAFFCSGFALQRATLRASERAIEESGGLYDLVLFFAIGAAVTGFICFVAAYFGVFYWPVVVGPLVIFNVVMFARDSNAKVFGLVVRRAMSHGEWLPLLIALLIAVPSVLPDITSDGQAFHLVYAKEWADAHKLTVDPFVREPLYAMNWLTLDALFELLGLGWYAPVLSGLCYVWSVVGIFALTRHFAPAVSDKERARIAYGLCLAATLSFLISPTVMHWGFTGLVDGPIGFLFLATIMAAVLSFERRSASWTVACAVLGGFFVGMKTSLFLFVPLLLAATLYLGWRVTRNWRGAIALALVFVACGAPWYVRNVVLDGDPIAPTLNLMIGNSDLFWSKADLAGQVADLGARALGPEAVLLLPFRLVFNTMDYSFREYGVSIAYLLMYLPLILIVIDFVRMRRNTNRLFDPAALLVFGGLTYGVAYYEFTSVIGRYTEVFAPTLSACLGIIAIRCLPFRKYWIAAVVALVVLGIPSPASYSWLTYNEEFIIQGLSLDRDAFLNERLDGYKAATFVSHTLQSSGSHGAVYEVGAGNLCLVLRRGGNPCVGDNFGPSRFEDLGIAIHEDQARDYVRRFNLAAFVIRAGGQPISNLTVSMLVKQLAPIGFALVPSIDANYLVIVRTAKS